MRLGDVCSIYTGTGFPIQYQGESNGIYPFYKVGDISRNVANGNVFLQECENYISEEIVKKIKGTIVPANSVVFAKIGEAVKLNRRAITSQDCLVDNNAMGIYPDQKIIYLSYFYHYMCNLKLEQYAEATTVPSVKKSVIENLDIPLPEYDEQIRISTLIDKINECISLRKQQLAKLDELVKARFVELFDSYIEAAKLSDVATVSGGLTKNAKRDKLPLRMPYLRVANVSFASIDVSEMLDIGLTEEEYEKTLLQNGDLLFVEGNGSPDQIGRVAIWQNEIVPCVHQNHLIKSRFNRGLVIPVFAMYYFMSPKGREQIRSKAVSTSGLYTLSVSKISDLAIPVPPIELQNQFAAFVEQTDKSKSAIQQSLDKLETLKRALMQKYFG